MQGLVPGLSPPRPWRRGSRCGHSGAKATEATGPPWPSGSDGQHLLRQLSLLPSVRVPIVPSARKPCQFAGPMSLRQTWSRSAATWSSAIGIDHQAPVGSSASEMGLQISGPRGLLLLPPLRLSEDPSFPRFDQAGGVDTPCCSRKTTGESLRCLLPADQHPPLAGSPGVQRGTAGEGDADGDARRTRRRLHALIAIRWWPFGWWPELAPTLQPGGSPATPS